MIYKVAVLGAGASGLAAVKECLAQGLDVVCFDQEPNIGGLWRYKLLRDGQDTCSSIYESTIMNSSKDMLAFSDFPVPREWPTFLPHRFVVEYLRMYCDRFDLKKHIKFNHKVHSVVAEIDGAGNPTGRWCVAIQKLYPMKPKRRSSATGGLPVKPSDSEKDSTFDESHLYSDPHTTTPISVSGTSRQRHNSNPRSDLSSESILHGQFHATDPNTAEPHDSMCSDDSDKSIPNGHSLLYDEIATSTFDFVIVCTGHHWKPLFPDYGGMDRFQGKIMHSHLYRVPYPFKDQRVLVVGVGSSGAEIASELSHHASQVLLSVRTENLVTLHYGDLEKYGLKPQHKFSESQPTISSNLLDRIVSGNIVIRPNISYFSGKNTIVFEDGTEEYVDAVIYCTGYQIGNPFLNFQTISGQEDSGSNRLRLYKHVFPPDHPNMAFVGMVQSGGGIIPVAEMQARWIAQIFSGNATPLPSSTVMRDQMDLAWISHCTKYLPRERLAIHIDYVDYMEELAKQIGCGPNLAGLWMTDWRLAVLIVFGPVVASQYRLNGPGKWDGAEKAIKYACRNIGLLKILAPGSDL
ncbi:hypothetical protein BASA50_009942 [Batrachochytrium salamandrivorans]|uniref:Flavin-containing monooxygenase n=1 Tax=Batrachochytrium salamandrivorans TaxID=1357716 RepID=A0ABQ8EZX5_9FUNG|nr:hypothetical protein BASA62_007546 [Batrachochytrium salamandrivorans]KAH6586682.1 hypothetical protein BASA61_006478 [Batrachochytrium salamandrivorans]KAH6589587.1 hypothetical protein BASA50_009942 [Batrachochytrium salamandrivorans]KAH9244985.1 hypothetical protein BASA81_017569 [Batrachochytrium salamandrivorans]